MASLARDAYRCISRCWRHTALFLMLLVLGLCGGGLAQESWVCFETGSVAFEEPETHLISVGRDSLRVRLTVPGLSTEEVATEGGPFDKIGIPGAAWLRAPGKPMLPKIRLLVAAPEFDDVSLEYSIIDSTSLSGYRVYPSPREVIREGDGIPHISREFCFDEDAYRFGNAYPTDIAEIVHVGRIRDQRIVSVAVYPVQFPGTEGGLKVCREVEITLHFANPGQSRATMGTGPFEDICRRALIGYGESSPGGFPALQSGSAGTVVWADDLDDCIANGTDYLVIAADRFCSGSARSRLEDFAEFRACSTGYNVSLIALSSIGSTDVALKGLIQDLYESRSATHWWDGHLGFVLLVGDYLDPSSQELMPIHRILSSHGGYSGVADSLASDNWYACVAGDPYLPAVMIGRFCVDDSTELDNMVTKVLSYEPIPDEEWSRRVFLTAGTSPASDTTDFENHLQGVMSLIPGSDFTVSALRGYRECPQQGGCEHDLAQMNSDSLNTGRFFVHYIGHGDPCVMGNYPPRSFTPCSAMNLTGDSALCVFTSIGCRTATFDHFDECGACTCACAPKHDCVGERLLNATSGGAVAFIGNTDLGTFGDMDMWETLYKAVFQNKVPILGMAFAEALYLEATPKQANRLVILGDPALRVWHRRPTAAKWDLWVRGGRGTDPIWFDPPMDVARAPDSVYSKASILNLTGVDLAIDESEPGVCIGFYMKDSADVWQVIGTDTLRHVAAWDSVIAEVVFAPNLFPLGSYDFRVTVDPDNDFEDDELFRCNNQAEITADIGLWRSGYPLVLPAAPSADPIAAYLKGADGSWDHIVLFSCEDSKVYGVGGYGGCIEYRVVVADTGLHSPAVADLCNDGRSLTVIVSESEVVCADLSEGSPLLEWEIDLDGVVRFLTPPCIADITGDGDLEIAVGGERLDDSTGCILRIESDGDTLAPITDLGPDVPSTPLALADLNGDGEFDMLVGTETSLLVGIDGCSGTRIVSVQVGDSFPVQGVVTADMDYDGALEVAAISGTHLRLYRADTACSLLATCELHPATAPGHVGLAVADIADTSDVPALEIVGTTAGAAGSRVTVWEYHPLERYISTWRCRAFSGDDRISGPIIGDAHSDPGVEIVVVTSGAGGISSMHIWNPASDRVVAVKDGPAGPVTAPVLTDFEGDGYHEVVWASSGDSSIYVGSGTGCSMRADWPMTLGDERGRRLFAAPLPDSFPGGTTRLWGRYLAKTIVRLDDADTLRISPGTRVLFSPGKNTGAFNLWGVVEAVGAEEAPIVFTCADPSPQPGDWTYVRLYCGSQGPSRFEHCVFEYADVGLMLHTNMEETDPFAPVTLRSCEFRYNDSYGLAVEGSEGSANDVDTLCVEDCLFRNNAVGGISLDDCGIHLDVSFSDFVRDTIAEWLDPYPICGIVILNCGGCSLMENHIGNRAEPISMVGSRDRGIDLQGCGLGNVAISRNCITHYSETGICVGDVNRPIRIDSNYVQSENASPAGAGFHFTPSGAGGQVAALVRRNVVRQNLTGVDVSGEPAPCLGDVTVFAGMNHFEENDIQIQNWTYTTVKAESCWWGGVPADSMFGGSVDYEPYLGSAPAGIPGRERVAEGPVYALTQNHPNPIYRGATDLRFSVPRRCEARVEIYDVLGRRVKVLHSGKAEPGWWDLHWDGTNEAGRHVSSGLYFCRLAAEDYRASIKMVVLR